MENKDKTIEEIIDLHPDKIEPMTFDEIIKQENVLNYPTIIGGTIIGGTKINVGSGDKCFKFEQDKGLWLGNSNFDNAPAKITMAGIIHGTGMVIDGTSTIGGTLASTILTDISGNTTSISTNATGIATNVTDIAGNASNITQNATDITAAVSDIAGNTSNITQNATDITAAVSDIAGNTSNITQNATDITSAVSDIAGNTSSISQNATAIGLRIKSHASGQDEIIAEINLSVEAAGVIIKGSRIQLDGDTTVEGSFSVSGDIVSGGTIIGTQLTTAVAGQKVRLLSSLIQFDSANHNDVAHIFASDVGVWIKSYLAGSNVYIDGKSEIGIYIDGVVKYSFSSTSIAMGTRKITGLGAPSADADAATKKYVDDNVGAFSCSDLNSCNLTSLGTRQHAGLTNITASNHHSSTSNGLAITPSSVNAGNGTIQTFGKLSGGHININCTSVNNFIAAKLYVSGGLDLQISDVENVRYLKFHSSYGKIYSGATELQDFWSYQTKFTQRTRLYNYNGYLGSNLYSGQMYYHSGEYNVQVRSESAWKDLCYYEDRNAASPIPTFVSGIEQLKKIKVPIVLENEGLCFDTDAFPEEFLLVKGGKIDKEHIDLKKVTGLLLKTNQELVERVEQLESKTV